MNVYPSSPAATNERMDPERTHYRSSGIKEASDSSHQKKLQGHHSMRVMALQLPWYFSPADGVASQVATPEFRLLNYQAASGNLKKNKSDGHIISHTFITQTEYLMVILYYIHI